MCRVTFFVPTVTYTTLIKGQRELGLGYISYLYKDKE